MDPQRERIEQDLRGLIDGEVRCDDVFLQLYASDASIYQIKPLGVVRPRSTEDVVVVLRYASENGIPIHARGAGTGLAGESLGPGLIVDFSRHMRRIVSTAETTVRIQPGLVHERLNRHLAPLGRLFGPDPAMSTVTTMGSVVAIDAAGSHWLKHGSARRHVVSLQIVLADGTVMEVGREPLVAGISSDPNPTKREIINQVSTLLAREHELIRRAQTKTPLNRGGYNLAETYSREQVDLTRLITGSEGTLALITELTVATVPIAPHHGAAMLFFDRLDYAARAVQEILPLGPTACDLMDRRLLGLARETDRRYEQLIPSAAEAMLLVEYQGENRVEVRDRLQLIVDRVRRKRRLAFDSRSTFSAEEIELFWDLPRKVVPSLYRLKGSRRALPFVEDLAIPPDALAPFLVEMQNVLKRHQVTASLFGHVGHGQLHIRPFLDLGNPDHVKVMEPLAADLYEEVHRVGGTISGEHGVGLSRTAFLPRQFGGLVRVFGEIKRIFDPKSLLNPGKIVAVEAPSPTANLRPQLPRAQGDDEAPPEVEVEPIALAPPVELHLRWNGLNIVDVTRSCNGCGACRAQNEGVRMCPMFRFAPSEEASPRAKANIIRGVLTGELPPETLATDTLKEVADLCVNCQMCRLECPAGVDIPKLVLEAKAAYVVNNGLPFSDWLLTHLDLIGGVGSRFSRLANWAISHRRARWVLEKVGGIAQGRKLPRFASRNFMRRASRRRLTRPTRRSGRKVLYFVDTYANYHDPQLAEALVAVLEHNGVAVYVHPEQTQSGMAMFSLGDVNRARKIAAHNVELLAEAVRQGYTILASEPSAVLCLQREYLHLLDDDDARLVAANVQEACTYLWGLHQTGKLQLDFRPVNSTLGYHTPCHLKALGVGTPGVDLMRLVPGLAVQTTEQGCSGMAGTFGLKRRNYRNSLRAGWPLISTIRESSWQLAATECSACKMQMEQGTSKPTIHPLKILALAYGLMPEIVQLLSKRGEELVVT